MYMQLTLHYINCVHVLAPTSFSNIAFNEDYPVLLCTTVSFKGILMYTYCSLISVFIVSKLSTCIFVYIK